MGTRGKMLMRKGQEEITDCVQEDMKNHGLRLEGMYVTEICSVMVGETLII